MDIVERYTDIKIAVSVSIDSTNMENMDFEVDIIGDRNGKVTLTKAQMLRVNSNCYLACLEGGNNGLLGQLTVFAKMKVTDTDYESGYRTEIVKIDPNIWVR